jgi:hypothetical protein
MVAFGEVAIAPNQQEVNNHQVIRESKHPDSLRYLEHLLATKN